MFLVPKRLIWDQPRVFLVPKRLIWDQPRAFLIPNRLIWDQPRAFLISNEIDSPEWSELIEIFVLFCVQSMILNEIYLHFLIFHNDSSLLFKSSLVESKPQAAKISSPLDWRMLVKTPFAVKASRNLSMVALSEPSSGVPGMG